jgi:hypothetical protein
MSVGFTVIDRGQNGVKNRQFVLPGNIFPGLAFAFDLIGDVVDCGMILSG